MRSWGSIYRRTHKKAEKFFDGIEENKATEGFSRYLDIPLSELKGEVNTSLFADFIPIQNNEMFLAESVQPTTNGQNVSITYQLSIKLIYDTYCAKEPKCSIPLFIQAPALQNFQLIQAPEGWNPTTYDEVYFALPVPNNEMAPPQIPIDQQQMQIEGLMPPPVPYGVPQNTQIPAQNAQIPAQNAQIPAQNTQILAQNTQIPAQIPQAQVDMNQPEEHHYLINSQNEQRP